MAPDTAIGSEWKSKESGKAGFHRELSSNANQFVPEGRRNTAEVCFSQLVATVSLKWAAQDRFLLPEGTCRPHLELTCTPLRISASVLAI